MKNQLISKLTNILWSLTLICTIGLVCRNTATAQQLFAGPEDAVKALSVATKAKDLNGLAALFGPRIRDLVSGDDVADQKEFEEFAERLSTSAKLNRMSDQKYTLAIGEDNWPFAAPIVKVGNQWKFDADAGAEELMNRRIGLNEIDAMYLCRAYAISQFEYFNGEDRDGDQVSEYAQKIASSPGQRDGLYWPKVSDDDDESPLGEFFAYAAAEGYKARTGTVQSATPFHGYYFKVLYRQGPSAPGGKFDYIINGNMIAGFALVAYPATWGNSGIMTFVVNQEGRVYQKNLGPKTTSLASAMTVYDPDVSWTLTDLD